MVNTLELHIDVSYLYEFSDYLTSLIAYISLYTKAGMGPLCVSCTNFSFGKYQLDISLFKTVASGPLQRSRREDASSPCEEVANGGEGLVKTQPVDPFLILS